MADQQIQFDFVARDDKLVGTANSLTQALTGVKSAADKASSGVADLARTSEKASDVWARQRKDIEQLYATMGKTPSKEVVAQLDEIEKKFLELGDAAEKGNKLAADSMRKLLSEAKGAALQSISPAKSEAGAGSVLAADLKTRTLTSGMGMLKGAIGAVGAALTVAHIASAVRDQMALADAMDKSAQKAGTSVQQFSTLAYAAQFADVTADQLTASLGKLANSAALADGGNKQLQTTFGGLDIKLKNADGSLRSTDQILLDVADRFEKMPDGAEKTSVAMQLMGKAGAEMIPFLNAGRDGLVQLQDEARKLGLEFDDKAVAASVRFNDSMTRLDAAADGVWRRLGMQLAPTLATAAEGLAGAAREGESLDAVFKAVDVTLKSTITVASEVAMTFKLVGEAVGSSIAAIGVAIKGEFQTAKGIMQIADQNARRIMDDQAAYLNKLWGRAEEGEKRAGPKTNPYGNLVGKGHAAANAKSRVSEWDNELNQQKLAHEQLNAENGAFIEFSKERERDFWKSKLDTVRMSSEELYSVEQKYLSATQAISKKAFEARIAQQKEAMAALDKNYTAQLTIAQDIVAQMARAYGEDSKEYADAQKAKIEIQKRYNEQQQQLANLAAADRRAQAQVEVDGERELAQLKVSLGLMTQEQLLEQERAYQLQLYELQRQALEDRLAQMDPEKDPVAHQQLLNQLLDQDRRYALEKQKLEGKIAVEKSAPGKNVFGSFEQSFAKSATGILTRATTLKKGLTGIWTSVGTAFVDEMVTKPLVKYASGLMQQLVYGQAAATAETTLATSTASTKVAASSAAAMAEGTNNAITAGTGAMSALAAIPFVGPALAAAGGPAMIALVMGMLGSIRSASGGFDIPSGMNPLTQLHQKEMVLPARYAEVIRGMADQGEGATGGGDFHQHININTVDKRGVERFLRGNQDALKTVGKQMARTFKNK